MPRLAAGRYRHLSARVVALLRGASVLTDGALLQLGAQQLATVTTLSLENAKELLDECALAVCSAQAPSQLVTAKELFNTLPTRQQHLPTGCPSLDQLLGGGLPTGGITELVGHAGTGKTQAALTAAYTAACSGHQVVFVDSGASCSAERLTQIHDQRSGAEPSTAWLSRIGRHRATTVHDLLALLWEPALVPQRHSPCLLVVDSMFALLSPVVGGQQGQGHALMAHVVQALRGLAARDSSVAVLVTNVALGSSRFQPVRAALGPSWSFAPGTRLLLTREGGSAEVVLELQKSGSRPHGSATALVHEAGLC